MEHIKTLQQAIQHFSDYENCRKFMVFVRWPDGEVRCPYCGATKLTWMPNAKQYRYYSDHKPQKFSLKVGTVFEDSPIGLEKWLPAVWLLTSSKNGVSRYELHRTLGAMQKTAWFMLHRIRMAMESESFVKIGGQGGSPVEIDETFIGAKVKNMHKSKRPKGTGSTGKPVGAMAKTIIVGMLERNGPIKTAVVQERSMQTLHELAKKHIADGSTIITDEWGGYKGTDFVHEIINHAESYVRGHGHTNEIENFWSLLKRELNGTYDSVEPFHLHRYITEQVFRYNNRATKNKPLNDADRFMLAASQISGKRLTCAELTGKVGETETF